MSTFRIYLLKKDNDSRCFDLHQQLVETKITSRRNFAVSLESLFII